MIGNQQFDNVRFFLIYQLTGTTLGSQLTSLSILGVMTSLSGTSLFAPVIINVEREVVDIKPIFIKAKAMGRLLKV